MVITKTPHLQRQKRPNGKKNGKHGASKVNKQNAIKPFLRSKKQKPKQDPDAFKALNLAYAKIQKDMLLLGCVVKIDSTLLHVALPGRYSGSVEIIKISEPYAKRLQEMIDNDSVDCPTLADLYEVGQLVYVKVVAKDQTSKHVYLSLDPCDLHSHLNPEQLVPGLVLAATITTKEDHGYTMDVGIRNVSAFLPSKNLNQNPDDVGRNLICTIVSVKSGGSTGTSVELKAFGPGEPWVLDVEEATIETIVPGCQLTFTVGEPVEYGLRGMLFENSVPAYVNKSHLTQVASSVEEYSVSQKLPATLLYVKPFTNEVFVTLRPFRNNRVMEERTFVQASIIEKAHVKSTDRVGVWFQFDGKRRALLPSYLLRQSGNVNLDAALSNFQVGSTHKVSVLYYAPIDETYVVTNNPDFIDTAKEVSSDIVCGNFYNCRVVDKFLQGYEVETGRVQGRLVYEWRDTNRNLQIGELVSLRAVFRGTNGKIWFTNVPSLMNETAPILKDWNQLDETRKDQTFIGLVNKNRNGSLGVKFFNNISGVASYNKTDLNSANLFPGATGMFTVTSFDESTRTISLVILPSKEQGNKTGERAKTEDDSGDLKGTVVEEANDDGEEVDDSQDDHDSHSKKTSKILRIATNGKKAKANGKTKKMVKDTTNQKQFEKMLVEKETKSKQSIVTSKTEKRTLSKSKADEQLPLKKQK